MQREGNDAEGQGYSTEKNMGGEILLQPSWKNKTIYLAN